MANPVGIIKVGRWGGGEVDVVVFNICKHETADRVVRTFFSWLVATKPDIFDMAMGHIKLHFGQQNKIF